MDDRFNTIAGWVLFAGIVALGTSIVASEAFHGERPEKMAYPIEGSRGGSGRRRRCRPSSRSKLISPRPDPAKGATSSRSAALATMPTRAARTSLARTSGASRRADRPGQGLCLLARPFGRAEAGTGTFLSQWLTSPKAFAPGTKMTFAGISNPQDRANVIAFLNKQSDSPGAAPGRSEAPQASGGGRCAGGPRRTPRPK
jgi:cytochrome c